MYRIKVDIRERELIEKLSENPNLIVEPLQLEIGDVILSEESIVERKTRTDFEASIIDNRLFLQLQKMEHYKNRILIVEGTEDYLRLQRNAVLGAYAAVCTKYSTAIFFTRDLTSTAEMIYYLAKNAQEQKEVRLVAKKNTYSKSTLMRRIVESFPSVGPKNAKELLRAFGSIKRIVNATHEELSSVPGIGKKRAHKLGELFDAIYLIEEDLP